MHLEDFPCFLKYASILVSILVSIWMHLEDPHHLFVIAGLVRFNPSFYMDASGRQEADHGNYRTTGFQS